MSRHAPSQDDLRDRAEITHHKRGERHRIKTELRDLDGLRVDDDIVNDLDEPGPAFKAERHHSIERANKTTRRDRYSHWKVKSWKRRSARRAERARLEAEVGR